MTSSVAPPQTLEAALHRINQLEEQLALAHRLFHQHSIGHQNLSDYLSSSSSLNGGSPSPPLRSVSQTSSNDDEDDESPTSDLKGKSPEEPFQLGGGGGTRKSAPEVDIGQFVLRALALRKNLTIGVLDSLEAEQEFGRIVQGSGLNEKQIEQVREWSGLS
ncbi:uncharacterized protein JCM6883_007457 [Sporobolomyces salmoneus]|uniref:uncharacterized protein n=1 Tax=Sporobolomyces salmoneus TaxID=183962 RepID=UPI00316AFE21